MSRDSSISVIRLDGELEFGRRDELREQLRLAPEVRRVLLDLSSVTYADSTALSLLVALQREAKAREARVAILVKLPQFLRLLHHSGLQTVYAVFEDRGAALDYLAGDDAQ